jgi:hypothetical protein
MVAKRFSDHDEELIRQEFEQKCWLPVSVSLKELNGLVEDINPTEICEQIQSDNLRSWCESMRVMMQTGLMELNFN